MSYMCGHMCTYQERRKGGYGRMVKFLLAKEKMRVRFPLSARGEVK
ncbi:ribosomal protein S14 [Iris pallida]|uniref:Ribosomal protein S14 (Chloroplast) n=1 Tax=Iris pallida TaxID=29817 RepID=A0AAX6I9U8_IRIPA|nr:ribosomal protein S14 [Iris pallida]